jgi:Ni,Fe-hydrogenase I large subunit
MSIKHVDPISRIEGHLGVKCTVNDGTGYITEADAHGNLWRGFENFLLGREPNDAITFTQRICGVCPVPHGQTSTYAIEAVLGYNDNFQTFVAGSQYSPKGLSANVVAKGYAADDRIAGTKGIPLKAVLIRNLILGAEFLMSSITHQYHLAAPSYIQGPNIPPWTPYFADSYYHPLLLATSHGIAATTNANQPAQGGSTLPLDAAGFSTDLWSAVIKSYVHALRIRRLTFEAGAMFAGRMPMTSSFIAGGVSTKKDELLAAKCTKFRTLIAEVGAFVVQEYVPIFLALGALYPNFDNLANATTLQSVGPVNLFDAALGGAATANLWDVGNKDTAGGPTGAKTGWGAGLGNFLSWGGFPQADGYLAMSRGYKLGSNPLQTVDVAGVQANLKEVITHSRYAKTFEYAASDEQYPGSVSRTEPDRTQAGIDAGKYSWMKAPRYAGSAMEVGPLARMVIEGYVVAGSPLAGTIPGYGAYTKGVGLDPVMIAPDVAVALCRTGLATLSLGGFAYGSGSDADGPLPGTAAAIAAAYYDPGAVITGVIAAWVVGLAGGLSTMDRLRARALESLVLVQKMIGAVTKTATGVAFPSGGWVDDLSVAGGGTYTDKPYPLAETAGFGATEAPRGALMHLCTQQAGKITKYQCVVPTTWNGSPKGLTAGDRGPIEAAIVNAKYATTTTLATGGGGNAITAGGGVEALRIAQSFDPCIACAVH